METPVRLTVSERMLDLMLCVALSEVKGLQQRFTMFNGGFSKDQLDWLDSVLSSADDRQQRVTIVSKSRPVTWGLSSRSRVPSLSP